MRFFTLLDAIAVAFFLAAWIGYTIVVEFTRYGHYGLNGRMDRYRLTWMRQMLGREQRMVDTQIMASLQNGTAFFASTSLIAIGGALTLIRSTDEVLVVVAQLPLGIPATRGLWEVKTIGLVIVFAYAFFKFSWSYRLYNYVAILLGAMPFASEKDTPEAEAHVLRTTRLFEAAGRHFNRGQRAFFFALGYLGWFVGPLVLILTTALVLVALWRRQFSSDALRALTPEAKTPQR
jgi:uncharacterized membrane protein